MARRLDASRRGGLNRNSSAPAFSVEPLASVVNVEQFDLTTPAGLRGYLGAALAHLAALPFTTATANAIAQLATAQRAIVEASDLEARIERLEQRTEHRQARGPRAA